MTSLQVHVRSYPHTEHPDEVEVSIAVAVGQEGLKTRHVLTLKGVQCDYLNTLVEDVTNAYMYEEKPAHVVRAAASVHKLAKAHAIQHEF